MKLALIGGALRGSVKMAFPLLIFPHCVAIRSPTSDETNPEEDARKNGEGNKR